MAGAGRSARQATVSALVACCIFVGCTGFEPVGDTAAVEQFAPPSAEGDESHEERKRLSGGLWQIFQSLDEDGDGRVQEDEIVTRISKDSEWRYQLLYILQGMRLSPDECKEIFRLLDADRSGDIGWSEFLHGVDRLRGQERSRAKEAIKLVIEGEPAMDLAPSSFQNTCSMFGSERCPMSRMPSGKPSLVFPGGTSRCLSATDQLYAFRVFPGETDKLFIDFQGGGACFNKYTTMNQTMCKTDIAEAPVLGIYNRSDERNPFRHHTIVMVVYCSGDLHAGSTAREYGGVVQRGYANARSAIDWAKENTAPRLSSLVIGGCSAGSLAAQMWSSQLLQTFGYSNAAVLADSYLDLFPGRTQQQFLMDFGICDTPLLDAVRQAQCLAGNLTVHTLFEDAMDIFPNVTFAQVNSKFDKTQLYFHRAVAYTSGVLPQITNGSTYLAAVNERLRTFHRHPNYASFLINAEQHCYTPFANFYTVTAEGEAAAPEARRGRQARAAEGGTKLVDWVESLVNASGRDGVARAVCSGPRLPMDQWSSGGVGYCDRGALPADISGVASLLSASSRTWSFNLGEAGAAEVHTGLGRTLSATAGAAAVCLFAALGALLGCSVLTGQYIHAGAKRLLLARPSCSEATGADRTVRVQAELPEPWTVPEEQQLLLMPL